MTDLDRPSDLAQRKAFARPGLARRIDPDCIAYDLHVVVVDVEDAVRSAGGWMYDRARSGWRVTAFTPAGAFVRPLRVLGVDTVSAEDGGGHALAAKSAAALAFPASVLDESDDLRARLEQDMQRHTAEVTVWGDERLDSERHFGRVEHRLTRAAQAFKEHALRAADLEVTRAGAIESFRSYSTWYPLDGGDLVRVAP